MTDGPQIIAIAGGAGSGKTTLAQELLRQLPDTELLSLDDFYRTDRTAGPLTAPNAEGQQFFDLNHPDAIDLPRLLEQLAASRAKPGLKFVVVEGLFALYFPELRQCLSLGVFVWLPDDLRLGRKMVRKGAEGQDPAITLRNYLNSGRPGHERYVAGNLEHADLILNGQKPSAENAGLLARLLTSLPIKVRPGGVSTSK